MIEKTILRYFNFLIEKYHLKYDYSIFRGYLGTNATLQTFTFYNNSGCFIIHDVPVRGELEFIYLSDINLLDQYARKPSSVKNSLLDVGSVEKEIWKNHMQILFFNNPFFWSNKKKIFRVLVKVIEAQITKTGQFYGIKIKNESSQK